MLLGALLTGLLCVSAWSLADHDSTTESLLAAEAAFEETPIPITEDIVPSESAPLEPDLTEPTRVPQQIRAKKGTGPAAMGTAAFRKRWRKLRRQNMNNDYRYRNPANPYNNPYPYRAPPGAHPAAGGYYRPQAYEQQYYDPYNQGYYGYPYQPYYGYPYPQPQPQPQPQPLYPPTPPPTDNIPNLAYVQQSQSEDGHYKYTKVKVPYYNDVRRRQRGPVSSHYGQQGYQGQVPQYTQDYAGQSQNYPAQGSSGYPAQGSSGYPAQGSSGYPAQGSSGYPAQGSSGYPAQGSSGYPAQGSSGYPAQGSSGYPVQGSSGYPAQGSSGYPAQGSSGYPAQGYYGYSYDQYNRRPPPGSQGSYSRSSYNYPQPSQQRPGNQAYNYPRGPGSRANVRTISPVQLTLAPAASVGNTATEEYMVATDVNTEHTGD